jgi:hypothetical protein
MATVDDPVSIGNFDKPVVSRPGPGEPAVSASPTEAVLKGAEARLDADAKKDEEALQPMETYADRLKDVGLDATKAAKILDEILLKGFYVHTYPITKTLSVQLRTRSSRDTKRIQEILDREKPAFDHHYHESLTRMLLACSLQKLGETPLSHPEKGKKTPNDDIEQMFQDRINYVDNQVPDPLLRVLFQKLWKFDRMITVALEEGAIENF